MATGSDPYGQFNFQVKIDGIIIAGFNEVSGLTTDTNISEYREGSDNVGTVRKLPGLRKYNNINGVEPFVPDRISDLIAGFPCASCMRHC